MDFDTPYASPEVTPYVNPSPSLDAIEAIRRKVARGSLGKSKKRVMLDLPDALNARLEREAESLGLPSPDFVQAFLDEVLPL